MKVNIHWELNNYCTGGCSYCPSKFWGGGKTEEILKFLNVANKIISHYTSIGRSINWTFTGGEPLEFFDLPQLLKLCKNNNGTVELFTNGGKLLLDWFALEPNIDRLNLTYHYWQNFNIIKYIIQTFKNKNKEFNISVPIRLAQFDDDWDRAIRIETEFNIPVSKTPLYIDAASEMGLYRYNKEQLEKLFGKEWVLKNYDKPLPTFRERREIIVNASPSFTGMLCNVGIDKLTINDRGFVSGSSCGISDFGNIWNDTLTLPIGPTYCNRSVCAAGSDQDIIKTNPI